MQQKQRLPKRKFGNVSLVIIQSAGGNKCAHALEIHYLTVRQKGPHPIHSSLLVVRADRAQCLHLVCFIVINLLICQIKVNVVRYHYQPNLECIMKVLCVMRARAIHASIVDIVMNIF